MGRVARTCCMGRPATQSDVEEVYAAPPAPLAVPGATAGAVRKAGRSRRARIVIAALPVRAAEIARQARALQGAAPPAAAARAGVPAAGHAHTADGDKEDAGEAPPPPRTPSTEHHWDELVASSPSASAGVRTLAFNALRDMVRQ